MTSRTIRTALLRPALTLLALASLAAPAAGATPAAARPDPAKGKKIAAEVCAPCHNADGNSVISTNPKLSGQTAEYIVKQLTDLAKAPGDKTGRENPVMGGFAAMLEPADRQNLAAWFSSQPPFPAAAPASAPASAPGAAAGTDVSMGQRIYRTGIPEKAVPACAGCHGPAGAGLPVLYPRIGGQHGDYVEAQLRAFREGSRRNNEAMWQIAFRLSDPEIKALADYVSGLHAQ
jgi:cytochrome c553